MEMVASTKINKAFLTQLNLQFLFIFLLGHFTCCNLTLLIKLRIIILLRSKQLELFFPITIMLFDTSHFLWCLAVCLYTHLCLNPQIFSQVPLLQSYMTPEHSAGSCHNISRTNWEDFAVVQTGFTVQSSKWCG